MVWDPSGERLAVLMKGKSWERTLLRPQPSSHSWRVSVSWLQFSALPWDSASRVPSYPIHFS